MADKEGRWVPKGSKGLQERKSTRGNKNQSHASSHDDANASQPRKNRGSRGSSRGGRGGRGGRNARSHDHEDHDDAHNQSSRSRGRSNRPDAKSDNKTGGRNGGRSRQHKPFYEEYISQKEYEEGVANGTLLVGPLRVIKCPHKSYVLREGELDIAIESQKHLNRACHGDIVAVKLVPRLERPGRHQKKKDAAKEAAKKKADEEEDEEEESEEEEGPLTEEEDLEDDSEENKAKEEEKAPEEEPEKQEERRYGHVVYIVEAQHPEELLGVIDPRDSRFHPLKERFPFMVVHHRHSIKLQSGPGLNATFHRARMLPWQAHQRYPSCEIVEEVGDIDNFDIQYSVLKEKNNVDHSEDFDESLTAELPLSGWTIPDDEMARRMDLRKELIFSIDPPTAKDLDDALSCEQLPNGNYKVGVHIADVSYFVRTDSPLDLEARNRATTVYFTEENVPMLPRILCDELCSLKGHVDRLAFSVIWELTEEGEKVSEMFTRSVINTRGQLDYKTAQMMIKEPQLFDEDEERAECARAVRMLDRIAKNLSKNRFANGSVALDSAELSFEFDENGEVVGVAPYERYDSHFLVEELMLLANTSVADYLVKNVTQGVLLRRHPPLDTKKLKEFEEQCKLLKLEVDTSSSLALHQSIQRIQEDYDGITMEAILFLISQPMQSALYCATNLESAPEFYHHYALNYPRYCHFTSPIRRYPDLITHRQLAAVLEGAKQPMSPELVSEICVNCNQRKRDADYASRDCRRLYLNKYLRTRRIIEKGIVVGLSKQGANILIPSYDVYKEITFNLDEYQRQWKSAEKTAVIKWPPPKEDEGEDKKDTTNSNKKKKKAAKLPAPLELRLLSTVDVELMHVTDKFVHTIDVRLVHPDDAKAYRQERASSSATSK